MSVAKLFIELYLDEDVPILIADLLEAQGFSAITAREANQLHKPDPEQLAFAISQQRAILTHNRNDFEDLALDYYISGQTHYGILLAFRRPPYEVVRRLLPILNSITADEMQNQVLFI